MFVWNHAVSETLMQVSVVIWSSTELIIHCRSGVITSETNGEIQSNFVQTYKKMKLANEIVGMLWVNTIYIYI